MSGEVNMDDLKDVPVCRRLRTKMYYVMGREHVDMREASPTGQYWCSRTATVGAAPLSENGYKVGLLQTLLRRTLLGLAS